MHRIFNWERAWAKRIPRQQIFEQESVPWCTIRAQGSSLGSMPVLAKNASHFFNAETYAKKFGNDTNDGVALATSNLQLARLKNKKPASKISGKDGFSEVP